MNKTEARKFLKDQAGNVWAAMKELSLDELQKCRAVADGYSTTNCWYGEYMMKDTFLSLIDDRISYLQTIAKETG
jgi:hypothetical protein